MATDQSHVQIKMVPGNITFAKFCLFGHYE